MGIIVFGIGKEFVKYHSILFRGLDDEILFCVDNYAQETEIFGHKVLRPDILGIEGFEDHKIVIFAADEKSQEEIKDELEKKYNIPDENVVLCRDWIVDYLNSGGRLQPECLRIDASTICQLDCKDCYMRKNNYGTVGRGYLKNDDFRRLLLRNPFIKEVELSNSGEPLLNPELISILAFSHKLGISVSFSTGTNFNTVSDELLDSIVKYGVKYITVSIDGASQDVYEQYRVRGDFNKVIDNIKRLNECKKKYNSDTPNLLWQYILMKHNEDDAYKAKELAEQLGMTIFYKLDWGSGFVPDNPGRLQELTGLSAFNREDYAKITGSSFMQLCRQMIVSPQINWDGRLLGCCAVYDSDWKMNVFEDFDYDIMSAINSDLYKRAVISLLEGTKIDQNVPCTSCKHYISMLNNHEKIVL